MHTIELDLGPWDADRPIRLLMDGFTDYFSANSMYAHGRRASSRFRRTSKCSTTPPNGFASLTTWDSPPASRAPWSSTSPARIPSGSRFIRITTNLKIYWDRIRVDNSARDIPFKVTEVPLAAAKLDFRGYPRVVEGNPINDLSYIYEQVSATGPYTRQIGNYTRYGDVTDLDAQNGRQVRDLRLRR